MEIIEYDVEDKQIYYIQEFYKDEYNELQQGIMYLANVDDREIRFTRARIPKVLDILYKKCYLNKNMEVIRVKYLNNLGDDDCE